MLVVSRQRCFAKCFSAATLCRLLRDYVAIVTSRACIHTEGVTIRTRLCRSILLQAMLLIRGKKRPPLVNRLRVQRYCFFLIYANRCRKQNNAPNAILRNINDLILNIAKSTTYYENTGLAARFVIPRHRLIALKQGNAFFCNLENAQIRKKHRRSDA